jgi:prevent-host-death family protein
MVTITAAELQKQFGRYRDMALREPVAVTHHGRESLVVLSADEYKRLKSMDDRRALYAWELSDDEVKAIDEVEILDESAQFDHEYK